MSNIIYKWNDESTYTGRNPPKQYHKGDVVPLHIFPPNILKQHMMYGRIIKYEPRQIPDVTLSISVMAHPSRANFFQGLRDKLGDVPFSIDQKNSLLENCKSAWRLHDSYSYYENEESRPGFIQPLLAAVKGSTFAKELIDGISIKPVGGVPFRETGNQYVGEMFKKTKASVKIYPSHYFSPTHFTGKNYSGKDKIYALHHFGSTIQNTYEKGV